MKIIQPITLDNRNPLRRGGYDDESDKEFDVTFSPRQCGTYNIYLFGAIENPKQFHGAIEVFNRATEDDDVVVHLSTPGGSIDATDTFLAAMRETEANVHFKATGGVHSAGTMILMHAPSFQLSRDFNALIHNGSTGVGGKFSDFKAEVKHTQEFHDRIMRRTYEGFLDPTELEAMLEGKDFWLDAEQFMTRFAVRQEFLKARHDAEVAAAESAVTSPPARKKRSKSVDG